MKTNTIFVLLKMSLLTLGTSFFFLLFGCQAIKQFMPYNELASFGPDREFHDLNYTGEGNFTDYVRKAGILRFVLDLGKVDLKQENLRQFELKGLPEVEFVCYLRIDYPLPILGRPKNFEAKDLAVEMILEDESRTEVFSEKAPLKNWIRSGSVGASRSDLYTGNTMFVPKEEKCYTILLKISEGNPNAPQPNYCSRAVDGKFLDYRLTEIVMQANC